MTRSATLRPTHLLSSPIFGPLLAIALLAGCDDGLPVPEVAGVLWYTDVKTVGCEAYEQAQGEYLESQFVHDPPGSNFCEVDRMLFNCHDESYSQAFSFSDFVNDDPGPWHRGVRQSYQLYDHPGGGQLIASGSGTIDFTSIVMSAETVVGSAVDVVVGAEWSIGPHQNQSVTSASIDHFDEGLTTTATHDFPIDGPYVPRAVVKGDAWGEYGGFPFVPVALTSGSFSASGTINADFTVCQEARLYNRETQCAAVSNGVPAVTDCGASSIGLHVHADTGNLVLLDLRDLECLTVDDSAAVADRFSLTSEVCSSGVDDMQQWTWLADGTMRPVGAPGYCLAPNPDEAFVIDVYPGPVTWDPLVVQPCTLDASERWEFY